MYVRFFVKRTRTEPGHYHTKHGLALRSTQSVFFGEKVSYERPLVFQGTGPHPLCERLPRTPFRGLWVSVWPRGP